MFKFYFEGFIGDIRSWKVALWIYDVPCSFKKWHRIYSLCHIGFMVIDDCAMNSAHKSVLCRVGTANQIPV